MPLSECPPWQKHRLAHHCEHLTRPAPCTQSYWSCSCLEQLLFSPILSATRPYAPWLTLQRSTVNASLILMAPCWRARMSSAHISSNGAFLICKFCKLLIIPNPHNNAIPPVSDHFQGPAAVGHCVQLWCECLEQATWHFYLLCSSSNGQTSPSCSSDNGW